jgi:hypothetical protein
MQGKSGALAAPAVALFLLADARLRGRLAMATATGQCRLRNQFRTIFLAAFGCRRELPHDLLLPDIQIAEYQYSVARNHQNGFLMGFVIVLRQLI